MNAPLLDAKLTTTGRRSHRDEPRPLAHGVSRTSLLGRLSTLALAALAAALGVGSFIIMSNGAPLAIRPNLVTALVISNLSVLLLLGASLAGRLTRVWVERRRGSAGSRLHIRLVLLFSVVAVLPTILVACRHRLVLAGHPGLVQ